MMDSKLSRLCDGLLEAGWLAAVISVPLFFNIHSERVFEPDKLTLMRSIAVFMALVWIIKFVDQKGWKYLNRLSWRHEHSFWRLPFVLPIAALLLIYLISSIFSVTPRASWAGSYQRLQGTYTMLGYVIIGSIAASTIRTRAQIGRLVTTVIITSLPVSLYGLIQHYGLDPLPWGGNVTIRVAGHMGNAIFIAAYLIMVVPLTLSRIIDAFTNILTDENLSYADVIRSGIYITLLGMQIVVIYWSGSRGPLIALGTALFSFMLVLLVSLRDASEERGSLKLRDIALAFSFLIPSVLALFLAGYISQISTPLLSFAVFMAVVLLSVLMIFIFLSMQIGWRWLWLTWLLLTAFMGSWLLFFNIPEQRMEQLQETPVIGTLFETQLAWKELPVIGSYGRMLDPSQNVGREKSNRVRVLIWEGVIDLITPHEPLRYPDGSTDPYNFLRPLIGYGPESMYQAYNRYYPPELATVEARNASPDRSHNETFDALVITGVAGFLAWQALYITVFYYGFLYLGVIRSRLDRNIMLGAWIGGGILGGLISWTFIDPIYFGVAVPTGTIIGLVVYLFYYALFGRRGGTSSDQDAQVQNPFHVNRLLMNALLAGVLAHYVEIHFGIAISSTRMYFFIFVALMYLISFKLPQLSRQPISERSPKKKRRAVGRITAESGDGRWGPLLMWSFLLALIIGIMGFEFTNYVLPTGMQVETGADLLASDIFHQSLFINAQKGFIGSPYIYLMIVLTWALGSMIVLSEMVKQNVITFPLSAGEKLPAQRRYMALFAFILLAIVGFAVRYIFAGQFTITASLVSSASLIGALILIWAAISLAQDSGGSRLIPISLASGSLLLTLFILFTQGFALDLLVAIVAFIGFAVWSAFRPQEEGTMGRFISIAIMSAALVLALPIATSGGWLYGLLLAIFAAAVLYILGNESWRRYLLPVVALGVLSWAVGMSFVYLHAINIREALLYLIFYQDIAPISTLFTLFFRPTDTIETVMQLRVLEALQTMRFLGWFYIFMFAMLLLSGISLSWRAVARSRSRGSAAAYATMFAALIVGIIVINQTNLRIVQADMIYKRGKPFDAEAMQQNDPLNWDVAIAIYEEAQDLAPWEDFYYLFLGRAFLERSAVAADDEEKNSLYNSAEDLLTQAQSINPLNTDHTANLARLFTRWYAADPAGSQSTQRLEAAERYYQEALELSPQNSIVRNEYARLVFEMKKNCDETLAIYDESIKIDPYYPITYFAMTDALVSCADAQTDETAKQDLYTLAGEYLTGGLEREPKNVRGWLKLGQISMELADYEAALESFAKAREVDFAGSIPGWNYDYFEATAYRDIGDIAMARAKAEQALQSAPADAAVQIETFLANLGEE